MQAALAKRDVSAAPQPLPAGPVPTRSVEVQTINVAAVPVATVPAVSVDTTETAEDSVTVATTDTAEAEPGWQVPLAATETEGQAITMLKNAKAKTGAALRGRVPYTEPVESGGQTLYRARFVGFDTKSAARKACRSLKRAKYACFAIYQ